MSSSDFFADLERQLVDATPRRAQRIRRARRRRAAALCTILLALVAGGAGLVAALDGSTTSSSSGPAAPSTAPAAVPTGVARPLGSFTTAVLNGTPTPGLGRAVANALQERGAKIGDVTNAATHDATRTQVFYAPGRRVDAGTVAQAIGIRGTSALMPITRAQRVLAGDQAKVVVLVGSDQNTAPHG